MQPLDGAYERVRRAGIHLTNLNSRVNALSKIISNKVVINDKPAIFTLPNGREVSVPLFLKIPDDEIPPIFSVLLGEIIYNLRSALDYLVYELARLDSGSVIDHTQFLIEDCKKTFKRKRNYRLKGIGQKHRAMLEMLQPYNGCDWTKLIRDLSDPDKHRQLTIANPNIFAAFSQGSAEEVLVNGAVNMNSDVASHITFRCKSILVDVNTLKKLKFQVSETLQLFYSDFK